MTSRKLSALSIHKQVFTKLHPDIEEEVIKLYETKQAQREEVYKKLIHEIVSQGEPKNDTFFKKHTGLVQMVSKPTLNSFADRENRVVPDKVIPRPESRLKVSMTRNPMETTVNSIRINSPTRTTIQAQREFVNRTFDSRLLSPEKTCSNQKPPSSNNSNTKFKKESVVDQSMAGFWENQFITEVPVDFSMCNHEKSLGESPSTKTMKSFVSPQKKRGGNAIRLQECSVNKSKAIEGTEILSRAIQASCKELLEAQKQKANPLPAAPRRIKTPQARVIRMKTNSSVEEMFLENSRTSKNDLMRSSYLEKIELLPSPHPSDMESFRFEFQDNPQRDNKFARMINAKLNRTHRRRESIKRNGNSAVGNRNERSMESLSFLQKRFAHSKVFSRDNSKDSIGPSITSIQATSNTRDAERRAQYYYIDDSMEKSLRQDTSLCETFNPVINAQDSNRINPFTNEGGAMNISSLNLEADKLGEMQKIIHSDGRKLGEISTTVGSRSVASIKNVADPLTRVLLHKSYLHRRLHKNSSLKPNQTLSSEKSKNDTLSLILSNHS